MMKFGLTEETIEKINSIFEKYPEVEDVIIYGSRAKGNYRTGSDIDLTLKGEQLTFDILSKISVDLDDLNTPYLFDISIFNKIHSTELQEHIHRAGVEFYKKNGIF